ncbi:MAG: glycosyltransferase [Ferruginibacter sp.]|uniref:glycosyltransferase n=1 Tax=Ferruginibacter sp. TaxID=1940288 RepID=UPI002657F9C0|nr:glycosyltransferase [Ferruginibacter sp.]MDB5280361.1 glycosyltransferase [Ferruginibacter sp.]
MQSNPLVSIGIANYNYANYIVHALNSIEDQSYQNIEVIIVDDHSTDNSVTVIEDWIKQYKGLKIISFIKNEQNLGIAKVSNLVLQSAKGKYFQVLDADDILLPDKVAIQVDKMEGNSNAALIYSNTCIIDEGGEVINNDYLSRVGYDEKNMPEGFVHERLFDFNFIPNSSVLVKTHSAKEVGGFDDTVQVQDYYLWIKLSEHHEVIYMHGNTAQYRIHGTSLSNKESTNANSIAGELDLLYRYYKDGDAARQKKIKKSIHHSAAYLYQLKFPKAAYWLKQDFLLNPSVKTFGYFLAINLGIPFSFFARIKAILS